VWKEKIENFPIKDTSFRLPDGEDGAELLKDFECAGLPFTVLVEDSGLIAWKGHPEDRNLKEDLKELAMGHILFETEDWHDDPDQPRKDPDEFEMQKELD